MIGEQQQISSVASSNPAAPLDACLSEGWSDLEVLRAMTSAVPADKRQEVLALLMACCAGNDA